MEQLAALGVDTSRVTQWYEEDGKIHYTQVIEPVEISRITKQPKFEYKSIEVA